MSQQAFMLEYFTNMQHFQEKILEFIEEDLAFDDLTSGFQEKKIVENVNDFKIILHLLAKISNNHHRSPGFFEKIEEIIKYFKQDIQKHFSNIELFNIFKSNKRILLFLFDEKIIIPTKSISKIITNDKYKKKYYPQYFYPEFKAFYSKEFIEEMKSTNPEIELDFDEFNQKRKSGENGNYLLQLIREDSIEDFIIYINQTNTSLTTTISPSIFETNPFLISGIQNMIGYAVFYGSIQVYNYLRFNNVDLNSSLWLYVVHSLNPTIIHSLEENHVVPKKNYYVKCYKEAVKCHHNNIMHYLKDNYYEKDESSDYSLFLNSIKNYNFNDFCYNNYNVDLLSKFDLFYDCCKYDYISIVSFLLENHDFDINYLKILLIHFFNEITIELVFNSVFF